jgi:hypothetical protein
MSTSPVDPEDIRAAAEVHQELGPEYSDAVVAAFLDKVDRAVAARVEARLAEQRRRQPVIRDGRRRNLLKGVALGVCAGALVAGVSISHAHAVIEHAQSVQVVPRPITPGHRVFRADPGDLPPPPPPPVLAHPAGN